VLRNVSLANKCLLLFGAAVVVIIIAALAVPWVRLNRLVDESERLLARQMIATWEAGLRRAPDTGRSGQTHAGTPQPGERLVVDDVIMVVIGREQMATMAASGQPGATPGAAAPPSPPLPSAAGAANGRSTADVSSTAGLANDPMVREAWDELAATPQAREAWINQWGLGVRRYCLAVPVRSADAQPELLAMLVLRRDSIAAAQSMLISTGLLLAAGLVALGLAVLAFYLITNRIILAPVRELRATADQVRSGRLDVRSTIHTGDEYEDLADSFNEMLISLQTSEQQWRTLNATLDDKLTELEQRNAGLADAARLKGEFLASVTHELRTPLNSIIGFAELLDEQATREAEAGDDSSRLVKRRRYIDNINSAGRALLELINGLLEMARVEAGKVQLTVGPVVVREACETMLMMMKPVADKRAVEVRLEIIGTGLDELGPISTDGRKLQQILYNLVSNAIKFTADAADAREARMAQMNPEAADQLSRQALVVVRAEHLPPRGGAISAGESAIDASTSSSTDPEAMDRVRISVLDTGPGIAPEDQQRIFEKFTQLDAGHGRKHAGTGLGLSIVKELTTLLQGEVMVQSTLGQGSMFSVILPARLDATRTSENKLELALRGALAASKSSNEFPL
jgi:signal transduction histidine kinase